MGFSEIAGGMFMLLLICGGVIGVPAFLAYALCMALGCGSSTTPRPLFTYKEGVDIYGPGGTRTRIWVPRSIPEPARHAVIALKASGPNGEQQTRVVTSLPIV